MADALDTILALTPGVICGGLVLWVSAWIAPKTNSKEPNE
jgi:hypothetical protein